MANAATSPADSTCARAGTLGCFLQDTLFHRQNTGATDGEDSESYRPAFLSQSSLTYPELLGVLGNKLFEVSHKGKGALMFVMMHDDSDRTRAYHRSSFQTDELSVAAYVGDVGVEMTEGKKAEEV